MCLCAGTIIHYLSSSETMNGSIMFCGETMIHYVFLNTEAMIHMFLYAVGRTLMCFVLRRSSFCFVCCNKDPLSFKC